MSISIPGSVGYPVVGDKSYEFLRDPVLFLKSNLEKNSSKIFLTRILNIPTICVCCPNLIKELLNDKADDFEHGYRSMLHRVYGDLILFENEGDAIRLKQCLVPVFANHAKYKAKIKNICDKFIASLEGRVGGIPIYSEFKSLMTSLCLDLFLDLDGKKSISEVNTISKLATQHWHGIISVPVQVSIPFKGQSTFKTAVDAKNELLVHIRKIINENQSSDSFLSQLKKIKFPKKDDLEQHLLLFTSALIPKAFSSLITSFLIVMAGDEMSLERKRARESVEYLQNILLEVERMWPPLFSGRRLAKRSTSLGSYKVPKDYAVFYMTYAANRDPDVFPNPDKFYPDRWSTCNKDNLSMMFTYGSGMRCCIGTKFIRSIILDVMDSLVKKYDWSICLCNQSLDYKYLPVARPSNDVTMEFVAVR